MISIPQHELVTKRLIKGEEYEIVKRGENLFVKWDRITFAIVHGQVVVQLFSGKKELTEFTAAYVSGQTINLSIQGELPVTVS